MQEVSGSRPQRRLMILFGAAWMAAVAVVAAQEGWVTPAGTYRTGVFDEGAAEIPAYDPGSLRLFVVNGHSGAIDALDLSNPAKPTLDFSIALKPWGKAANSVAVRDGIVAAAVEAEVKQQPGKAVFFDADGKVLASVTVGALPDMIVFTPDGRYVLVANEGEPSGDYKTDPEGTVSVIDLGAGAAQLSQDQVRTVDFRALNGKPLPPGMRAFGPGASVAQDIEPEYIAVSEDSRTAWVTLQENNAIAEIDIPSAKLTAVRGLGFKDHRKAPLDASDEDQAIEIKPWPVFGMYLPDAIATITANGRTYLITANEGDSRDYEGFSEEARVAKLKLDPVAFPGAKGLQEPGALGRLKVTKTLGDTDGDGDYDALYAFGARSFSVWSTDGRLVFDSGDQIERILAARFPSAFNADHAKNGADARSDDKGPEPEGIALAKLGSRTLAFIGLERMSAILVYDVTNPEAPEFVEAVHSRDFAGDPKQDAGGDLGPEGMTFIPAESSPTGQPLLVVAFEVSGSTTAYRVDGAALAQKR